jgi:DNA replication protein DnaC
LPAACAGSPARHAADHPALERASLIVTSNKPFGRWGEVFGDDVVAAAMIDRLVHHAEVISLKGDSYRLRNRGDLGRIPAAKHDT